MSKKVCVDILLYDVSSYRACAIASEVIKIGQNKHHHSIPQPQIRVNTLSDALKPPVRQLRNGFSNSAQNLDSETIFKSFDLDGWLKVSYLLD